MNNNKLYRFFTFLIILFLVYGCKHHNSMSEYQNYNKEIVNISFDSNGGNAVPSQQIEKGSYVLKPDNPERIGYDFDGWYINDEKWNFYGNVALNDITLQAKWIIQQHTITIKIDDDSQNDIIITQNFDSIIPNISEPIRAGYTFIGWNKVIPERMGPQDIIIEALWDINQYNLIIKFNNGDDDIIQKVYYNECINLSTPERTGYLFTGWNNYSNNMPDHDITIEANWKCHVKYQIINGYCKITGYNGVDDIIILGEYDGYPVSEIVSNAFNNCLNIKSVSILNGLTKLQGTFIGCANLESITIPESVTEISGSPFRGCNNLTFIRVDKDNEVYDSRQDCNAVIQTETNELLYGCSATVIPTSIVSLGDYAFYGCLGLINIDLPSGIKNIGQYTFSHCSNLIYINLPYSLETINRNAFEFCNLLTKFTLPANVKTIGVDILRYCDSIEELYLNCSCFPKKLFSSGSDYLPSSLKKVTMNFSIPDNCFSNCGSIENIVLLSEAKTIGKKAFYNCVNLQNVSNYEKVISIGDYAFYNCLNLKSICDFKDLEYIGKNAFENCVFTQIELCNISYIGEEAFYNSLCHDFYINSIETWLNLYREKGSSMSGNLYVDHSLITDVTIPEGITTINPYCFGLIRNIKSIRIPAFVESIGEYAFHLCGVENVSIDSESRINKIPDNCFSSCYYLTSVNISEGVTSIGSNAFSGCSRLTNITIPDTVVSIGNCAFQYTGLRFINIPESVVSIGSYAFNCNALKIVVMSKNVSQLSSNFCDKCMIIFNTSANDLSNLCEIYKNSYDVYSFDYINNDSYSYILINENEVYDFNINPQNTLIEQFDFDIELSGYTIKSLGNNAFKNCSCLKSIIIPTTVDLIEYGAFSGCSQIEKMTLPFTGLSRKYHEKESVLGYIFGLEKFDNSYSTGGGYRENYYSLNANDQNYYMTHDFRGSKTNQYEIPKSLREIEYTGDKLMPFSFIGCHYINKITLNNNITNIPQYCFYGCFSKFEEIIIPDSVTSIDKFAFYQVDIGALKIGTSLNSIGYFAFDNSHIDNVYIDSIEQWCDIGYPCNIESLKHGKNAHNCYSATSNPMSVCDGYLYVNNEIVIDIIIPETITQIRNGAFVGFNNLTSIVLPNTIKTIGDFAFSYCKSLNSIIIPDSVTNIGEYAFEYCESLNSIIIPESVKYIEKYAFYECSSLTIYCEASSKPYGWKDFWVDGCAGPVIWGYKE